MAVPDPGPIRSHFIFKAFVWERDIIELITGVAEDESSFAVADQE